MVYGQSQHPSDIEWKKIDTHHFEVIFPAEIYQTAQKTANLLEYYYYPVAQTYQVEPQKLSVILSNQSVISNGYFALAPRYSTFYTTPLQNSRRLGNSDWLELLTIHEFRHAVQYEKHNRNFTKFASFFYGQFAPIALSYSRPNWFGEGDAVLTETIFTESGRGRLPSFDMHIRSLLLSDNRYSYDKAKFRSFRDYYPSHYHLGYLLVTHAQRQYGYDVWDKVLERTSKFSFWPYAFSRSLKKITGKNTEELYADAMDDLKICWQTQHLTTDYELYTAVNRQEKDCWTNYTQPHFSTDGNVLCLKNSMKQPTVLTKVEMNGNETDLIQVNTDYISVRTDKVCWVSERPDVRWSKQSFSDIYILDYERLTLEQITENGKYFSPALSPFAGAVAAVEYTPELQCNLVVLDSQSHEKLGYFTLPDNDFIRTPAWAPDGNKIVFTHSNQNGQALSVIDVENFEIQTVIPYTTENISRPVFYDKYILYNSSYSGIDNIYAIDTISEQRYQLTNAELGAANPSVSQEENAMVFQSYSAEGYNISLLPLDTTHWKPIEEVEIHLMHYFEPLLELEANKNPYFENHQPQFLHYSMKNYRSGRNLLNLHSWALIPSVPFLQFQMFSQNILNTLQLQTGWIYNTNERSNRLFLTGSYAKYFPIFDFGVDAGGRNSTYTIDDETLSDNWNETSAFVGVRFPFDLSKRVNNSRLEFSLQASYSQIAGKTFLDSGENGSGNLTGINYDIDYSNFRQSALRNLYPRLGQRHRLKIQHSVFNSDYEGYLISTDSYFYFPGLFANHSFFTEIGVEFQGDNSYRFQSQLQFPRGYQYGFYSELLKLSANYAMPLWYPDKGLGKLLYFKRLRSNIFWDYARGGDSTSSDEMHSAGLELYLDFHPFRIEYLFSFGVRCAYKIPENALATEILIFNMDF